MAVVVLIVAVAWAAASMGITEYAVREVARYSTPAAIAVPEDPVVLTIIVDSILQGQLVAPVVVVVAPEAANFTPATPP